MYLNLEACYDYMRKLQDAINSKASASALAGLERMMSAMASECVALGPSSSEQLLGGGKDGALTGSRLCQPEFWSGLRGGARGGGGGGVGGGARVSPSSGPSYVLQAPPQHLLLQQQPLESGFSPSPAATALDPRSGPSQMAFGAPSFSGPSSSYGLPTQQQQQQQPGFSSPHPSSPSRSAGQVLVPTPSSASSSAGPSPYLLQYQQQLLMGTAGTTKRSASSFASPSAPNSPNYHLHLGGGNGAGSPSGAYSPGSATAGRTRPATAAVSSSSRPMSSRPPSSSTHRGGAQVMPTLAVPAAQSPRISPTFQPTQISPPANFYKVISFIGKGADCCYVCRPPASGSLMLCSL